MAMVLEIFDYRQLGIEARVLENHTEACTHSVRILDQALAENLSISTGRGQQRRKNFEQGGFPSTVRTKQCEKLSTTNGEGYIGKGYAGTI